MRRRMERAVGYQKAGAVSGKGGCVGASVGLVRMGWDGVCVCVRVGGWVGVVALCVYGAGKGGGHMPAPHRPPSSASKLHLCSPRSGEFSDVLQDLQGWGSALALLQRALIGEGWRGWQSTACCWSPHAGLKLLWRLPAASAVPRRTWRLFLSQFEELD